MKRTICKKLKKTPSFVTNPVIVEAGYFKVCALATRTEVPDGKF
jgi:hypothetical protein